MAAGSELGSLVISAITSLTAIEQPAFTLRHALPDIKSRLARPQR
jgi:hypothetical protein